MISLKVAMWGVGIFVVGLLGLVLINLFGNITVTNQFNYTTMKNAVQAAMYDSLDIARYRTGFCLCTTDGSKIGGEIKMFTNKNQYVISDIKDGVCENINSCVALFGEYRLDANKFESIFKERFENVISNNKEYKYTIKEVIEYPPKVSVRVISSDEEFFSTDKDAGGYDIVNQIDAIIETNGGTPNISILEKKKEYVCATNDETSNNSLGTNDDSITSDDSTNVVVGKCNWHYTGFVKCNSNGRKGLSSGTGTYTTQGSAKDACNREARIYCETYGGISTNTCQGTRTWRLTCRDGSTKNVNSANVPSCSCDGGCREIKCLG